jgi:hypothetical protein
MEAINIIGFSAAIIFEIALSAFVIWSMANRAKFANLIDCMHVLCWATIVFFRDSLKARIRAAKVKKAREWLAAAEINDIVSQAEKCEIVLDYLKDNRMMLQRIPSENRPC